MAKPLPKVSSLMEITKDMMEDMKKKDVAENELRHNVAYLIYESWPVKIDPFSLIDVYDVCCDKAEEIIRVVRETDG